ncbi:unnamed protein product [Gadus morhua 'NCC']
MTGSGFSCTSPARRRVFNRNREPRAREPRGPESPELESQRAQNQRARESPELESPEPGAQRAQSQRAQSQGPREPRASGPESPEQEGLEPGAQRAHSQRPREPRAREPRELREPEGQRVQRRGLIAISSALLCCRTLHDKEDVEVGGRKGCTCRVFSDFKGRRAGLCSANLNQTPWMWRSDVSVRMALVQKEGEQRLCGQDVVMQ